MTDLRAELRAKWDDARRAGRGGREWRGTSVDNSAPLRVLAAVRETDDRVALLMEAPLASAPRFPFNFRAEGISLVDQRRRDEDVIRVAITLEKPELQEIFEILACDLWEIIRTSDAPEPAFAAVYKRLEAWQACLRAYRKRLSREAQVGLFGELTILRMSAAQIGYGRSIEAWQGPLDGLHDFCRNGVAIEVKSSLGTDSRLRINRLDQLESTGLSKLLIARPRLYESLDGRLLAELVSSVRQEVDSAAPELRSMFDELLLRAGYVDVRADDQDMMRMRLRELYGYVVRNGFPRLPAHLLPTGIVDCSYAIDERAAADFRIGEAELAAHMLEMGDLP